MKHKIEQARVKAEEQYQEKLRQSRESDVDVRDFFDDEELERILQSNDFFTGKIADYEKMERYDKLRKAARWMMSHSLEVAATSSTDEGKNGIVVIDIRRLASLRGEELRVFTFMNALADTVYVSGLMDDVIRFSFTVNNIRS